jgi:hypothetical protein
MVTWWSLLFTYGDLKPFYLHDVALPGIKILLDFLDFLYFFCHILLHAYNCVFWHLFPSFPYFGITFSSFTIFWYFNMSFPLVSLSNQFFILPYLSKFSHIFFPIFCHLFSSLPYEHAMRGFVFYKNQKIKMTLDEWS